MNKDNAALKSRIESVIKKESGIFAIAVLNPLTGQELSINSQPMRSASLIKLFIMAEAFARISEGTLQADATLSFMESHRVGGAGILQNLPAGTYHSILELVELMITESDNIATNLLIEHLGREAINARIQKMGCADSRLTRRAWSPGVRRRRRWPGSAAAASVPGSGIYRWHPSACPD